MPASGFVGTGRGRRPWTCVHNSSTGLGAGGGVHPARAPPTGNRDAIAVDRRLDQRSFAAPCHALVARRPLHVRVPFRVVARPATRPSRADLEQPCPRARLYRVGHRKSRPPADVAFGDGHGDQRSRTAGGATSAGPRARLCERRSRRRRGVALRGAARRGSGQRRRPGRARVPPSPARRARAGRAAARARTDLRPSGRRAARRAAGRPHDARRSAPAERRPEGRGTAAPRPVGARAAAAAVEVPGALELRAGLRPAGAQPAGALPRRGRGPAGRARPVRLAAVPPVLHRLLPGRGLHPRLADRAR